MTNGEFIMQNFPNTRVICSECSREYGRIPVGTITVSVDGRERQTFDEMWWNAQHEEQRWDNPHNPKIPKNRFVDFPVMHTLVRDGYKVLKVNNERSCGRPLPKCVPNALALDTCHFIVIGDNNAGWTDLGINEDDIAQYSRKMQSIKV